MTVGRILVNGADKGSGFVLATMVGVPSRVVLTANHVARGEAASLQFALEEGQTISIERVERAEDLDVAVLYLCEEVPEGHAIGHAIEAAAWEVNTRPSLASTCLAFSWCRK